MKQLISPHRGRMLLLSMIFAGITSLFLLSTLGAQAESNGDYALDFDGVSDFIEFSAPLSTIIGPNWQTTKTISVWFRPTTVGQPAPVDGGDMIVGDFPRWFGIYQGNVAGQDRIWVWNGDNDIDGDGIDSVGVTYTPGEWIHITLVNGDGLLSIYKNGVFAGSTGTGASAHGHPGAIGGIRLRIGGAVQIGGNAWETLFTGQIDEVKIWDVALTEEEIRHHMYHPADSSVRAYYSMSNGTGNILTEDNGNGWNGILQDGREHEQSGAPPDGTIARWAASGALTGPRHALDFDGSDDYVDLGTDAATLIGAGWADTKTVELWAKPAASATAVANAAAGDQLFAGPNWGVAQANIAGQDQLWLWNNDGSEARLGIPYTPGEWIQLALVHSGGQLQAYANGRLVGQIASGNSSADGTLTIGGLATGQHFQGQIDELRLWSNGRGPLQIQTDAFQTVERDQSNLVAYYRFDQQNEAGQTDLIDGSSYGRHGTLVNMDPASDWVPANGFNTWIGGDSPSWADGGNWSQYVPGVSNVSITNYPASFPATVQSPATLENGIFAPNASLNITSSLTVAESLIGPGQIAVSGDLINLGHIELPTVTVELGGSLQMPVGAALTVTGLLQNNGTLSQTHLVDGSQNVHFYDTGNYGGLRLDPQGQNLGATAVGIRGNQNCTGVAGETVLRCFNVVPSVLPSTGISMTFAFANTELGAHICENLNVYHWNGVDWDTITPTVRSCAAPISRITVENVTDFSPFVLSSVSVPTAVSLQSVQAAVADQWPLLLVVAVLSLATVTVLGWQMPRRENKLAHPTRRH